MATDLLQHPVWKSEDLGEPMPASAHAVSFALPEWKHVVGYEEKDPAVTAKIVTGYPRFVMHPLVKEVAASLAPGRNCIPLPSAKAASECAAFVTRCGHAAQVVSRDGLYGVATGPGGADALKAFWQHTGVILSSRQAEAILNGRRKGASEHEDIRISLRRQLAGFYDCAESDVFLAPTGMAAQYAALKILLRRRPKPTVQLGFPYVDTLKVQQKFGVSTKLLHNLDRIDQDLEQELARMPLAGCFGEVPGNPLLGCADLRKISRLLRPHGVPLVADDVVATPLNVDLSGHADFVATSLTKFIAGTGDVMGGALVCNPRSPLYGELEPLAHELHEELLWGEDAAVLDRQAKGFPERMRRHNASGLRLAERLRAHPAVERVWYPKWEFSEAYDAVRRRDGGWGALITFLPRKAESTSPAIYNRLQLCKGPSLGTIFTLACPFTLLAHYTELDWAESCGVSRHLIRISVGLEDPEDLWQRLDDALSRR